MIKYKDAGVDIDKATSFIEKIKSLINVTKRPGVIEELGGFGALFELDTKKIHNPILVSSTDGVGTKLKIAQMCNKHDTVGIDLVAMCVNDILTIGAEPLFFLDYLATGKLDEITLTSIIRGIVKGCQEAKCALIGGETAEMPGFYKEGEYDVAGFVVGCVEKENIINGEKITKKDILIGLASNGLHSNGYSLVRKILFEKYKFSVDKYVDELGTTIGEELLRPTRIYVRSILYLLKEIGHIRGIAHITGGGLIDNLPRILPQELMARIENGSWEIPPVFTYLKELGPIENGEMLRVFNNGIGMVLVVENGWEDDIMKELRSLGEKVYIIGEVVKRPVGAPPIEIV